MRLYIFNVTDYVINSIKENNSNDFIKIINHHSKFDDICKQEIRRFNKNPSSVLFKKQYRICEKFVEKYFNFNDDLILNAHERINTNDCFFNF